MKRLAPGVYDDGHGGMHLDLTELLAAHGFPDTPANREALIRISEFPNELETLGSYSDNAYLCMTTWSTNEWKRPKCGWAQMLGYKTTVSHWGGGIYWRDIKCAGPVPAPTHNFAKNHVFVKEFACFSSIFPKEKGLFWVPTNYPA